MEQKILKTWQKEVIQYLCRKSDFSNFYLTGGTALSAYYLQHRISDDLDFFSYSEIDPIFIHGLAEEVKAILKAEVMNFAKLYDRFQFFYELAGENEEVKVEFTRYPFRQLEPVARFDGLNVDSLHDIAVNKLATVLDRFDPKDFVDLYFLLPIFPLEILLKGLDKKFGLTASAFVLGSELSKVRRVEALPKMIKPLTVRELKDFFSEEIKKLSEEVLEE